MQMNSLPQRFGVPADRLGAGAIPPSILDMQKGDYYNRVCFVSCEMDIIPARDARQFFG